MAPSNHTSFKRSAGDQCLCLRSVPTQNVSRRAFLGLSGALGALSLLPPGARAVTGHYRAMLLACIDPRFPKLTLDHMAARSMLGRYSQFNVAGAAIGAVAPKFSGWHQTFWDNLAASIQLHNIPTVIVLNHRDCGGAQIAYGDAAVSSRDAETKTHRNVLLSFRNELTIRQPGLRAELGLMDLDGTVERIA